MPVSTIRTPARPCSTPSSTASLARRWRKTSRPVRSAALDGAAVQNACRWVQADFAKPVADRLLFPIVTMADTPATQAGTDKILANIVFMFDKLWNQRVTTTDPEVQRMYKLLVDIIQRSRHRVAAAAELPVECG